MKICRKCGTPMPDQTKYCKRCGASLDGAAVRSLSGEEKKRENVGLTIGLASGLSILVVGFLFLYIFAFGGEAHYYLTSGYTDNGGTKEGDAVEVVVNEEIASGELSFTAGTYEVEANKDVDMTKYLQYSGMELMDINWTSDSDKMYVGSDGHVSLSENGIECTLTAVSKSDDAVKAQCQLKTRTAAEDLAYQVKALNTANAEDEELDNGVIRVAYNTENSQMIDLSARRYEPAVRTDDYSWDKTLFYTLEDVDLSSDRDGKINSYFLEKKQFINNESGNKVEYEIYHNPDTDVINKIVSIEYYTKKLAILEFYFTDDGEVNFIYSYEDVNYTPSYATPNRDGERFLFSHDTLVTYRIVEGGQMTNYCYGSAEKKRLENSNSRNVKSYSECDTDIQQLYDEKEQYMLNLAYITREKITSEEGISTISGYVYDSSGNGIEGTQVQLVSEDYNCALFALSTDDDGFYEIRIPTRDLDYSLTFDKENRIEEYIYDVNADVDEINLVQEIVYMSPEDSEEYECGLEFYDALNKSEDGYGMAMLTGVDIEIRRGVNNRIGEVVMQLYAEGSFEWVYLTPGMYTVHTSKSGYLDCYSTLFVSMDTSNYLDVYATPALNEDEIRIVLTWGDDPNDLDSHLFTPSTSGLEEDYHICYYNMSDTRGNTSLDVDDTDGYGPETTTINHIQQGLYKFYVCDYTDCVDDNEESQRMSNSGATVRVYGSQGLIQTFNVPVRRNGVIWEVFEIRDGTLIPNQRYYDSIGDKTWWQSGKW